MPACTQPAATSRATASTPTVRRRSLTGRSTGRPPARCPGGSPDGRGTAPRARGGPRRPARPCVGPACAVGGCSSARARRGTTFWAAAAHDRSIRLPSAPDRAIRDKETAVADTTPRSVLVTGASRGIGQAIAERFLAAGDKVASLDRGGQPPAGVLNVVGDVTDSAAVDAAFAEVEAAQGPVEILVANAGITRDQLILRMTDEDFDQVLDINLGGAFRCVRRAAKGMIRMRRGRIILVSSVVALYGGAGQVNYSASKAGLIGMAPVSYTH